MNLELLEKYRVIWQSPESFKHNEVFKHYEDGKDYYKLFAFNYKIVSISQLLYHYCVLRYLNPDITIERFRAVCISIATQSLVDVEFWEDMIEDAYYLDDVPKAENKKFFFNPKFKLTHSEKMKIVKGCNEITEEDIYEAIASLKRSNIKITATRIAKYLDVSRATLYRHMTEVLKEMIQELKSVS